MKSKKILITSALPYVNNVPHLGNIIGCVLPGDVYSRYCKQNGKEYLYICGADEYGTTTETKAREKNIHPKQICDKYIEIHKKIYKWFQIDFDYFGRTSTNNPQNDLDWKHTKIAQDIFTKIVDNDFVEEKEVEQLYSSDLQSFVADRFVVGICPKCFYDKSKGDQCDKCNYIMDAIELIKPYYKQNPEYKLEIRKTTHLYLNLPKLENKLNNWFSENKHNWSESAISITTSWLKNELKMRCITRDFKWGTPVPDTKKFGNKYQNKIMYNWFDAPIGYISITANYLDNWEEWWKNPKGIELVQFLGVDNVSFHSVIFPATLIGSNDDYTLVGKLCSTNYLNYEGQKFSKSNEIGIFGDDAIDTGIPSDVWRFYLLIQRPENKDTEFSWKDLQYKTNGELVNNLGNFIHRVLTFTYKKFDKTVPEMTNVYPIDEKFIQDINSLSQKYVFAMEDIKLKDALGTILGILHLSNNYLAVVEPWKAYNCKQKGCGIERCRTIMHLSVHIVSLVSRFLFPFMPTTSKKINDGLNFEYPFNNLKLNVLKNVSINEPEMLFHKIEDKTIEDFKKKFG